MRVYDFLTRRTTIIEVGVSDRHDAGDTGLMDAFIGAVSADEPSRVLSGAPESLRTHLAVFAAERARETASVVTLA